MSLPGPGDLVADKYRIDRAIGRGGMGVVYAATHELLHQTVALKLLLPEVASYPDAVSRFLNEARASARIRSPHVATVMDVGTFDEGGAYMVMEFLEGMDLEALLMKDGVMSVEAVAQYVLQALEGVAHAHSLGIVHRDLKPSNLFLAARRDGPPTIKVLDFGISKATQQQDESGVATATHTMLGSPLFMSPEQVRSAKNVDARTDLWSMGVIMYRLLTGKLPFMGDNLGEVLSAILVQEATPITTLRPDLPPAFVNIIGRCLERDRDRRYPSAAALAIDLEAFAGPPTGSVERICRVLGSRRAEDIPVLSQGVTPEPKPSLDGAAARAAAAAPMPSSTVALPEAANPDWKPAVSGSTMLAPELAPALTPDSLLGPSAGPWSAAGTHARLAPRRWTWIAAGVTLVAVAAAGAFVFARRSPAHVDPLVNAPQMSGAALAVARTNALTSAAETSASLPSLTPPPVAPPEPVATASAPAGTKAAPTIEPVQRLAPIASARSAPEVRPPPPPLQARPARKVPDRPPAVDSVLLQRN